MEQEQWTNNFGHLKHEFKFDIDEAIIGLPGTGKTYTLQKEVMQDLVDLGYSLSNVAVSTFTNSMADEFQERAEEEFAVYSGLDWFGSTHSLCAKLLYRHTAGNEMNVVNFREKEKFCNEYNYRFNKNAEFDDSNTADAELGNALFDMRNLCINSLKDPVDDWKWAYRQIKPDVKVNKRVVRQFNANFEDWKDENDCITFIDMIKKCLDEEYIPPVSVLIEDEFQDKSPLELKLFELWSQEIERVYVAGDPFQAIYSFKGSKPGYMIEAYRQSEESRVLDTTYRFGENLWNFSESILTGNGYGTPNLDCSGETEVERISWMDYRRRVSQHQEDNCFHLVRFSHLTDEVAKVLRNNGVISREGFNEKKSVPYENYFDAVKSAMNIAKKVEASVRDLSFFDLTLDEVEYLVYMAPETVFSKNKNKILKTIETKEKTDTEFDLGEIFNQRAFVDVFANDNPFHMLNEKRFKKWYKHKSTMASAFENGEDLSKHISHDIATIHKSKGKDADIVFLLNASTATIKREGDSTEEARVFFVGATRAAEKLYIVDTQEKHKFKMGNPGSI